MPVTRELLIQKLAELAPAPEGETFPRINQGTLAERARARRRHEILWAEHIAQDMTEELILRELVERAIGHGRHLEYLDQL